MSHSARGPGSPISWTAKELDAAARSAKKSYSGCGSNTVTSCTYTGSTLASALSTHSNRQASISLEQQDTANMTMTQQQLASLVANQNSLSILSLSHPA